MILAVGFLAIIVSQSEPWMTAKEQAVGVELMH